MPFVPKSLGPKDPGIDDLYWRSRSHFLLITSGSVQHHTFFLLVLLFRQLLLHHLHGLMFYMRPVGYYLAWVTTFCWTYDRRRRARGLRFWDSSLYNRRKLINVNLSIMICISLLLFGPANFRSKLYAGIAEELQVWLWIHHKGWKSRILMEVNLELEVLS